MTTDRFGDALKFAEAAHRGQRRKGTDIPYIAHLMSVTSLVLENGGDEDQAIAALLHDAVEDQGGMEMEARVRTEFGNRVADIVMHCTDAVVEPKPPWRERKEAYIEKLSGKPADALLVSLADKLHNATTILEDYSEIGDELWSRFRGGRDGTLWYYQELSETFSRLLPGRMAKRLEEVVRQLRNLAIVRTA